MSSYLRGARVAPELPPPPSPPSDPEAPESTYYPPEPAKPIELAHPPGGPAPIRRRRSSQSAPVISVDAPGAEISMVEAPSIQAAPPVGAAPNPSLTSLLGGVPFASNHSHPRPGYLSAAPVHSGPLLSGGQRVRNVSNLGRMQSTHRALDTEGSNGLLETGRMRSETQGRRVSVNSGGVAKVERRLSIQPAYHRTPSQKLNVAWQKSVWDLDNLEENRGVVPSQAATWSLATGLRDVRVALQSAVTRPIWMAISLVVLAVLLFCGVFGVLQAAKLAQARTTEQSRGRALRLQSSLSFGVDHLLSGILSTADALRWDPSLDLQTAFGDAAADLMLQGRQRAASYWASASTSGSYQARYDELLSLPLLRRAWLAPGGSILTVQGGPGLDVPISSFHPPLGAQLFNLASSLRSFAIATSSIDGGRSSYGVTAPQMLADGATTFEFVAAIFLSSNDLATWTPSPPYPSAAECPDCQALGFWGFIGATVDVSALFQWAEDHLAEGLSLAASVVVDGETVELTAAADRDTPLVSCTVREGTGGADAAFDCSARDSSKNPAPRWKVGVLVAVAVIAVSFGTTYMLLVSSRAEYWELLHQMLPAQALKSVRRGENPVEYYAGTTILFLDICNFTVLSKTMGPIDLVQLLNELYTFYDEVAGQYEGLYKLDQIGDTYMLCAGCPYRLEPKEAARRASHFGLDLIVATRRFVSSKGHKVAVRVGLNTGSVVGCIIGQARPKYSIFGNAVNKASRLESTCTPMHVQVSESTAELLERTGEFILHESKAELKGIGLERTFFISRPGDEAYDAAEYAAQVTPVFGGDPSHRGLLSNKGENGPTSNPGARKSRGPSIDHQRVHELQQQGREANGGRPASGEETAPEPREQKSARKLSKVVSFSENALLHVDNSESALAWARQPLE